MNTPLAFPAPTSSVYQLADNALATILHRIWTAPL
jgi:hypothetical protein